MTLPFSGVSSAANASTFNDLFRLANNMAAAFSSNTVTADASAGGSVTTGNVAVNGSVAILSLSVNALSGGNNTVSGVLPVTSNVSVGNSTANVQVGFGTISVGAVSVNSTVMAVGANVYANATTYFVGNSTVNAVVNSTAFVASGTGVLNSTAVALGSNVFLSTTTLSVGNSTANLFANSVLASIANSTGTANHTPLGFYSGLATHNATGFYVGANVTLASDFLSIGNSSVNVFANSSTLLLSGAAPLFASARDSVALNNVLVGTRGRVNFIGSGGVSISASDDAADGQVNVTITTTSAIAGGAGGANTDVLFNDSGNLGGSDAFKFNKSTNTVSVGANVTLNATSLGIGNTTVNAVLTATALTFATGVFVNSVAMSVGVLTANATVAAVGANVVANTSSVVVGNSTVFFFANATLAQISNTTATINVSPVGMIAGITTVNSTGLFVGANSVVNSSAHLVGNSTVFFLANSTIAQVVNSTATINVTPGWVVTGSATVNGSGFFVGANVSVNTTVVFVGNSTVSFFANSSAVNTQSAVLATVVSVGSNAAMNTSAVAVGNATVFFLANSTNLQVVNASGSAIITPTQVTVGTVSATLYTGGGVQGAASDYWANVANKVLVSDKMVTATQYQPFGITSWSMTNGVCLSNTITINSTLANPTTIIEGRTIYVKITQDATGGRTLSFGNCYVFDSGGAPSINATANKTTLLALHAISTTNVVVTMPAAGF